MSIGPGGTQGNDFSLNPAISADGRFVAFNSFATNLVPGDTNGATDIFVRDRELGTTRRVSVGPGGVQANEASTAAAVSANGRFVAFDSFASNLVPGDDNFARDVFVHDRRAGATRRVSVGSAGEQRRQLLPSNFGGWSLRRLRVIGHQPGAGRHERRGRHLRPRPSSRAPPDE